MGTTRRHFTSKTLIAEALQKIRNISSTLVAAVLEQSRSEGNM